MTRNGKHRQTRDSVPASKRPGTMGLGGLFPELETETPEKLAEAFVGRLMTVEDGEAYDLLVEPYCKSSGNYDLTNRSIKSMYKRYVVGNGWDEGLFLHVLSWVMTNKMPVDSYSFSKAARLHDLGRLPLGALSNLSMDAYDKIVVGR
mgnify:FL=1